MGEGEEEREGTARQITGVTSLFIDFLSLLFASLPSSVLWYGHGKSSLSA